MSFNEITSDKDSHYVHVFMDGHEPRIHLSYRAGESATMLMVHDAKDRTSVLFLEDEEIEDLIGGLKNLIAFKHKDNDHAVD